MNSMRAEGLAQIIRDDEYMATVMALNQHYIDLNCNPLYPNSTLSWIVTA
jgi:hypothetical protein